MMIICMFLCVRTILIFIYNTYIYMEEGWKVFEDNGKE